MMTESFRYIGLIFAMSVMMCISSCSREDSDMQDEVTKRTILAYISADNPPGNELAGNVEGNLQGMEAGLAGNDNCNILALIDVPRRNSYFLNIHDGKREVVFTFDRNLETSDPATLELAIDYMLDNYPGNEYGLILWSHGGGWVPRDKWFEIEASHSSKSAGITKTRAQRAGYFAYEPDNSMELDEMAEAIPDHLFNFILFDACYMGCVEVAYALRNKARYVISSTTEIMGTGFPYWSVARKLANGYLMGACRDFYTYYNSFNDYHRLGEVSLVRTEGLDSLACCFRKIVSGKPDVWRSDTVFSNIQYFDRFNNGISDRRSVFFDLNAVARTYSKSETDYFEFRNQLERCVLYAASTPELFIYCPPLFYRQDHIIVKEFSGLSVYIPFKDNDSFGLNDSYAQLEWSKATNYK